MRLLPKILLAFWGLGFLQARANNYMPNNIGAVIDATSKAARDDGYPIGRDTYLNDLDVSDSNRQIADYATIGLYKNSHLIHAYAVRELSGDIVDLKTCTIYRYRNLLKFQRDTIEYRHHESDAGINQIAAEVGCEKLTKIPSKRMVDKIAFVPATSFAKLAPLMGVDPTKFIPTSTLVELALMAGKDESHDTSYPYPDLPGKEPYSHDGYASMSLTYDGARPLGYYKVRIATGDIINEYRSALLRYPDLMHFRTERMRFTGSAPVTLTDLEQETGDGLHEEPK